MGRCKNIPWSKRKPYKVLLNRMWGDCNNEQLVEIIFNKHHYGILLGYKHKPKRYYRYHTLKKYSVMFNYYSK